MRREPDYFEDREEDLVLVFIAKRLSESKNVEKIFEETGIDYLIEVDTYVGGVLFRSERSGAFFYVAEKNRDWAAEVLRGRNYRPQQDSTKT